MIGRRACRGDAWVIAPNRCVNIRLGVTGASSHATRLSAVEAALAGRPASVDTFEVAARNAAAALQNVNADIHASEEYRRAMVAVFTERALARALERAD